MRYAIAFILFGICAYAGYSYSGGKRDRLNALNELIRGIKLLGIKMDFRPLPIYELLQTLDGELWREAAQRISADGSMAEAFGGALEKLIGENGPLRCLDRADVQILLEFGSALGGSDLRAQRSNIALALKRLEENAELLKQDVRKSERIYRSLGILGGLALAIIVL